MDSPFITRLECALCKHTAHIEPPHSQPHCPKCGGPVKLTTFERPIIASPCVQVGKPVKVDPTVMQGATGTETWTEGTSEHASDEQLPPGSA